MNTTVRLLARAATLMAGTVLATFQARAQGSRWERQVQDASIRASRSFTDRGYVPVGEARHGGLNTGESAAFTIDLKAGTSYVLIGVCDVDCEELDLALIANGYEVDAARSSGNVPIVQITPRDTRAVRVHVAMASCRKNPCWYAITVIHR